MRDALRVAGELELGRGRAAASQKSMSRSLQDEHAPALDAPVHAPRHLQDLVGAEVRAA